MFGSRSTTGNERRARLATATAAACLTGCTTVVIPPADAIDPVPVYLLDYGRHSSLALTASDVDALVEYAYGDWNWFVLDRTEWYDVCPTLFWPTQGALGRQPIQVEPARGPAPRFYWCEEVLEITVSRHDVAALASELDGQFDDRIESVRYRPSHDLAFVPSDRSFHVFHNCNHAVAEWLRTLGCRVRGSALVADFAVRGEESPDAP